MIDENRLTEIFSASTAHLPRSQIPMIEVPFGYFANAPEMEKGAFIALYTRDIQPYTNYEPAIGTEFQYAKYAGVLMVFRWDHKFGFPGGNVDPGETLVEAAIRELKEETGEDIQEGNLEKICSHLFKRSGGKYYVSNLFAIETSPGVLERIQNTITHRAIHSPSEILGSAVIRFETVRLGRGIENTLSSRLPPSVLEELDIMMEKLGLVTPDHLEELRKTVSFIKPAYVHQLY